MTIENKNLTTREFYQIIWERINSESNLLNQKLSTLINSQAFLILGYVSLLNSPERLRSSFLGEQHHLLLWLFPIAALLIVIFMYASMISSHLHIKNLAKHYSDSPTEYKINHVPSIGSENKFLSLANSTIVILPIFLATVWVIMIYLQYSLRG